MRYVVYGAGGIGGTIGAQLHQSAREVVLIARGPHLRVLRTHGLTFQTPEGEQRLAMQAVGSPREITLRPKDVVLLTVKSQDTAAALRELAEVADPAVAVMCVQNGVANERIALRHFEQVYGVFVYVAAQHLEPGVVQAFSSPTLGVLDLGRVPEGIDEREEAIAADLQASGFASRAEPRIMRWKYGKLLSNLANAVEAAVGPEIPAGELVRSARSEALACYAAAQIHYATEAEISQRSGGNEELQTVDGRARRGGSSWQSLARGAAGIETDYLNGEIVLLGRLHGVPTPVNEALCRIARQMARDRAEPGSVTLLEIERAIA